MNPEDLFHQRRLSGIVRQLGGIVKNLEEFTQENPHVIAPSVVEAMIGNLKDDMNILLREVNILGSADRQALRERRYVCRSCQNIFMSPLVAGICDECRGRGITSSDLARPEVAEDTEDLDQEPEEANLPDESAVEMAEDDSLPSPNGDDGDDPFAQNGS